jgi:hypothetical protein
LAKHNPIFHIEQLQDSFREQVRHERAHLIKLGVPVADFQEEVRLLEPADFDEAVSTFLDRECSRITAALREHRTKLIVPQGIFALLIDEGTTLDAGGVAVLKHIDSLLEIVQPALETNTWLSSLRRAMTVADIVSVRAELAVAAWFRQRLPGARLHSEPALPSGKHCDVAMTLPDGRALYGEVKHFSDDFYAAGEPQSRSLTRRALEIRSKIDGRSNGKTRDGVPEQLPLQSIGCLFLFDTASSTNVIDGGKFRFPWNLLPLFDGSESLFSQERWRHVSAVYRCGFTFNQPGEPAQLVLEAHSNPAAARPLLAEFPELSCH